MSLANINNLDIYYEVHGQGLPLILISGIGYTHWQWNKMLPYLIRNFKVIVLDNRGVGKSGKPKGPYTAEMLACDTVGLLDFLGLDDAIVLGHSMGGFIAQSIAINFPSKVSKLILSSTHFGGKRHIPIPPDSIKILTDTSKSSFDRFVEGLAISTAKGWVQKNPDILSEWIKYRKEEIIDPECYKSQLNISLSVGSENNLFEEELKHFLKPTLLIFGEEDKIIPKENAYLLAESICNNKISILPNVGHFIPLEAPELFGKEITDFCLQSK